ncbi:hypothetical protein HMPREF9441_00830 [Paraprevotella clara YIT 11840]|uniref:Uncharacterized protein n=2 Tax=Paraprevotella TaxID=577309 RepID=F3QTG1_9BACT|nr:hypothetical protein HMPREF9442_01478 [Paraprevotella xylaniphila YIT 11841]EHH01167.1 hypothetical protein HMPREF9441_00830 [Paraprevotella clara YIT 11840]
MITVYSFYLRNANIAKICLKTKYFAVKSIPEYRLYYKIVI